MCLCLSERGGSVWCLELTNSLSDSFQVELQECSRKPKAPWWLHCFHEGCFEQRERGDKRQREGEEREREGRHEVPVGDKFTEKPSLLISSCLTLPKVAALSLWSLEFHYLSSHTLTRCSERQEAPVWTGLLTDTIGLLHRRQLSLRRLLCDSCLNGSLSSGTYFHCRWKRNMLKGKVTYVDSSDSHADFLCYSVAFRFL